MLYLQIDRAYTWNKSREKSGIVRWNSCSQIGLPGDLLDFLAVATARATSCGISQDARCHIKRKLDYAVNKSGKLRFRQSTHFGAGDFAIVEHNQRWDAANAVFR